MALLEQYSTWSYLIDLIKKHTPPTNLQNLKWRNKNLKLTSTLHASEEKQIKVQCKIYLYLDGVWLFWIQLKVSWKFWRHPLFPEMPNTHSSCKLLYHPFHWVEWNILIWQHIFTENADFLQILLPLSQLSPGFLFAASPRQLQAQARHLRVQTDETSSTVPCRSHQSNVFFLYCHLLLDFILGGGLIQDTFVYNIRYCI